jgi:hypothetical protein
MPQHKDETKEKSEAQLWTRLRRLKARRNEFNAQIDAEVAEIKAKLGSVLSEQ